jgi:hypothetical protein
LPGSSQTDKQRRKIQKHCDDDDDDDDNYYYDDDDDDVYANMG